MCPNSVSCPLCFQSSFPNIDTLRNSLIKAANDPVPCPVCNELLLGLDKLTIHLFSHTSLLPSANESIPNIMILSSTQLSPINNEDSSVIQEKSNVNSTSFSIEKEGELDPTTQTTMEQNDCVSQIKCDICGLAFRSADLLRMHNKLIHRVVPDGTLGTTISDVRYQCHLCAKVFKMKGSLRVHLKVVHLVGLQSKKDNSKLNICQRIKSINEQTLLSGSSVLNTTITTQTTLGPLEMVSSYPSMNNNNNNLADSSKIGIMDAARINGGVIAVRAAEAPKIWECDICVKSFTTKYFLKKHKRLHTGEMPYTCNICGKTFTFQQSYHKHLLYHSDEKPHSCQTCGRAFKELSTLHNHERIHSGEKPFKCETCGKCFRQRVSYLVHKRIHTGVMPYKCTACEKSFRYKVSQRTHKCAAQPPGTVIRQGGDLLEKLLHSTSILTSKSDDEIITEASAREGLQDSVESDPVRPEIHDEELLIRSIDEIVSESCNKMGIKNASDNVDLLRLIGKESDSNSNNERTPSPSVKLENLCLYSPCDNSLISPLDAICEEALKTLLNETT